MTAVILVGNPNVGKSVIFNYLTGMYATVSNYPGTTVDILQGKMSVKGKVYKVVDTPGLYSLLPLTEEEKVTRKLLVEKKPKLLIHVVDTKNIRRMLVLTLQLLEAGLPVILDLNLIDEATRSGIWVDTRLLGEILGIPVVATTAVQKSGLGELKSRIAHYRYQQPLVITYSPDIEAAISAISATLTLSYGISIRMVALLLLSGDELMHKAACSEPDYPFIREKIMLLQASQDMALSYRLAQQRQAAADNILQCVLTERHSTRALLAERWGRYAREPVTGIPILCLVLYFGLYQVVGKFGAGFLVDYIDEQFFNRWITPEITGLVNQFITWQWLQSLMIGEYGIFTLGIRYAVVIILPIVGTFFLVFSLMEDSGYLPRLALLVDRIFKKFGLNGRAIIPFTLGTGCGTMAVMVTRTLETKRERILATFLLALAVPCSAQLGIILSLLSHNSLALALWGSYLALVFLLAGWISARVLPGGCSSFYMELPPLRIPVLTNIFKKAGTRMFWYFIEILPVFIITSFIMWLLHYCEILQFIILLLEPLMLSLGLPYQAAPVFLQGFFRRDYGAAGLYDLHNQGLLADSQLLVAAVTITLFVPCVAQLAVMIKERGLAAALLMVGLIAVLALASGWLVRYLLSSWAIIL